MKITVPSQPLKHLSIRSGLLPIRSRLQHPDRTPAAKCKRPGTDRKGEEGTAVIVVVALLSIILLYIAANARTLHYLGRELKIIEKQQIRKLATAGPTTNSVQTLVTTNSVTPLIGRP
jgi:hypothetical protein